MDKKFAPDYVNLKMGSWLGWQIETNWTNIWFYAFYSLVRPIASTLILVFIFLVVAKGQLSHPLFPYIYIGNAFFMYVYMVLFGISWVIHEDREHYQMLKYIFITPRRMYYFLAGRGLAKLAITTFAVLVTLVFGKLALGVPINLGTTNYFYLISGLILGLIGISALGVILAALSMVTAHHSFYLTEGIAGLFYLISGAIYPIDVLPGWLKSLALGFPLTYWVELLRRALGVTYESQILGKISSPQLLLILFVSTVVLVGLSSLIYKLFERISVKYGLVDRLTNY
ncbi:MAG: ABC transporter permease [candidate division Zixibacteria bacterium]|nr:ABC transporter permease [candidate division Zixibacteria bacterium]